jgi:glyoxylase-like metal-dependent hydrolase (beta-lactamase superfamily II)
MTDETRRQFLRDLGTATLAVSAVSGLAGAASAAEAGDQKEAVPAQSESGPALTVRTVAPDTEALTTYVELPSLGQLPVSAFLIRSAQPVLVDTGLAHMRENFMESLRRTIALEDLRWLWLTHTDADHTGSLKQVLDEAPNVRIVTSYLGMGKLNLQQFPVDRVYLLNPGQSLDVGDRQLLAVRPPTFDAPETTGFLDTKTRALFSADCFGALMKEPVESASEIAAADLREGLVTWATVDAPWLSVVDEGRFGKTLGEIQKLEPSVILSSHLPPATGLTKVLLQHLAVARTAPRFVGPDQAAFEQMISDTPGKN